MERSQSVSNAGRRLRVLILTHHYPPEVGAPQTRLSETAAFLRSRGHDVCVVTSLPSYPTGVIPPAYRGRMLCTELVDGIRVHRTWTYAKPGPSVRLRLANQLSFAASALAAAPLVGARDVILAESPPLFVGATAAAFGLLARAPVVLHLDDLWPAVAIELGALRNDTLIRAAELFERSVYRMSRRLIVVTETWKTALLERGVPAAKISLVNNGVDTDDFDPLAAREQGERVRSELSLDGKVVIACVGTVGHVYDYELMLRAAQQLEHREEIRFLFVGDGGQAPAVRERLARLGLSNVTWLGAQPHERVRGVLAAADVAMVALRPLLFTRGQLPIRILEAMAMARPVVLAGSGEARRLVEGAGAGLAVDPGDADAFIRALDRLGADEAVRREMGARGRRAIVSGFSRSTLAERTERVLQLAVDGHTLGLDPGRVGQPA